MCREFYFNQVGNLSLIGEVIHIKHHMYFFFYISMHFLHCNIVNIVIS